MPILIMVFYVKALCWISSDAFMLNRYMWRNETVCFGNTNMQWSLHGLYFTDKYI